MKTVSFFLVVGIILSITAFADSTFFDNENDIFIMGGGSAAGTADAAPAITKAEDGGRSCPLGYNRALGKCVNSTSSMNSNGDINQSDINRSPKEANQLREPEEIQEPAEIEKQPQSTEKQNVAQDTKGYQKLAYSLSAIAIALLVAYAIFRKRN